MPQSNRKKYRSKAYGTRGKQRETEKILLLLSFAIIFFVTKHQLGANIVQNRDTNYFLGQIFCFFLSE